MKARTVFYCTAVVILLASVALAQSPTKPRTADTAQPSSSQDQKPKSTQPSAREASSGMATGRKSGSIIVVDRDQASGKASGREISSGMATGRRQHEPVTADVPPQPAENARNSAHATESLSTDKMANAHTNPMYQDKGQAGTNPLYESKDKVVTPPSSGSTPAPVVEYKDGEDATTHTRPTSKKPSN